MSSTTRLHLAVEDKLLYPALQSGGDAKLANMGRQFQQEMKLRTLYKRMQTFIRPSRPTDAA